jgi:hypothetical protein
MNLPYIWNMLDSNHGNNSCKHDLASTSGLVEAGYLCAALNMARTRTARGLIKDRLLAEVSARY